MRLRSRVCDSFFILHQITVTTTFSKDHGVKEHKREREREREREGEREKEREREVKRENHLVGGERPYLTLTRDPAMCL